MKSKWNLLYAAIATALLLTACGTDTSNENPDSDTDGAKTPVEETDKGAVDEQDSTDPVVSETPDASANQPNDMEEATLTVSDAQDYKIAVLPHYTLTSEEPGKDSLLSDVDGSKFMRIETVANEEGTYDYLVENMTAVLEATNEDSTPTEVVDETAIPAGDGIEHVKVLTTQTDNGPVTGIVFERGSIIVRLTIFDSPTEEHFLNFLHMGETIVTN